jgi:hypothetical protein
MLLRLEPYKSQIFKVTMNKNNFPDLPLLKVNINCSFPVAHIPYFLAHLSNPSANPTRLSI